MLKEEVSDEVKMEVDEGKEEEEGVGYSAWDRILLFHTTAPSGGFDFIRSVRFRKVMKGEGGEGEGKEEKYLAVEIAHSFPGFMVGCTKTGTCKLRETDSA